MDNKNLHIIFITRIHMTKHSTSYKIYIVLLVFYVALSQATTITYAPAPAINTNRIINISLTNINQTQSITSQKL